MVRITTHLALNDLRSDVLARMQRIRQQVAQRAALASQQRAPVLTGRLRSTVQAIEVDRNTSATVADTSYAAIQERRHGYMVNGALEAMAELDAIVRGEALQ